MVVTGIDQNSQHDHQDQDELNTDHLSQLPPEVCERICQMLPSLSLYSLPSISNKLCLSAKREMHFRHCEMKEKVMICESTSNNLLHQKVSMICPGLVLYYCPNTSTPPPHHTNTTTLRMLKSIFTTTSSKTGQALCVPHFSATNQITLNTTRTTIPPPKCYQLLPLPLCDPASSVLLFLIPVDPLNLQKIKFISGWNICLPHRGGLSSILPPEYSRICLPSDHQKGLLTLAKDILDKEPEINLMMQPLMDPLNMYKDPNTLVMVVTDSSSDPGIQLILDTFFAKIFLPLKVSWVKMVFTDMKKEEARML